MGTAIVRHEDVWDGRGLRENVLLMDVRTPAEFREVHIPGSLNVPLGDVKRQLSGILERAADGSMAIVCHTRMRSQVVHDEFERLGIPGIPILKGGIASWVESGLPVIRGERSLSLQRQVQIAAGSLMVLGVLLGTFVSSWFLALPGLIGLGLVHAGATGTCTFAVLLARLPCNRE